MAKKPPTPPPGSPHPSAPPWDESPGEAPHVPEGPGLFGDTTSAPSVATPYVVLARKYRPQSFADLIGQESMVTTLHNAFASGRIAQGYMLTGVRGVGKTTTARILARGLNYEVDGKPSGPTVDMPTLGRHCAEIMASRHPDVVEMDAASNTGIDNVREIIESARYKPISARTKVFIIDEVHMLSKGAFNALLKTLEEPPEHVKFIFATTEIRKVPVTVLSRCQRFDLRRVDVPTLSAHFKGIVSKEGAKADDDALALIARAAEGSVRDGLSILDQAIATASGAGDRRVSAVRVRSMLGLADRGRIFDLLELIVSGDVKAALAAFASLYRDGGEPAQMLADLAEAVHQAARAKVIGDGAASEALSLEERARASLLGSKLSVPLLSRLWQMLIKGYEETARAGDSVAAAEMVLIRVAHTADLPSPDELIRALGGDAPARLALTHEAPQGTPSGRTQPPASINRLQEDVPQPSFEDAAPEQDPLDETIDDVDADPAEAISAPAPHVHRVATFADVVALAGLKRNAKLKVDLEEQVSLVRFDASAGAIDLFLLPGAPQALPNELREKLRLWTGRSWIVMVSKAAGQPTLGTLRRERDAREREILSAEPAVRAVLDAFPGAKVGRITAPVISSDDEDEQAAG